MPACAALFASRKAPGGTCCGALAAHAGLADRARELAHRTAATFGRIGADVIVTNAAGCGAMLRDYGHLLGSDDGAAFSSRVRDVTELLAEAGIDYYTRWEHTQGKGHGTEPHLGAGGFASVNSVLMIAFPAGLYGRRT